MQDQEIIPMHTAKSTLSQLVKRAAAGEIIYIGAYGRAEVKLVALDDQELPARRFGALRGLLRLPRSLEAAPVSSTVGVAPGSSSA